MLLRSLRTYYLLQDFSGRFRDLIQAQFFTAALQIFLPFKLGDILRVYVYKKFVSSYIGSSIVYLIEKIFDIIALFFILAFSLVVFDSFTLNLILPVVSAFLFGLFALITLPDILSIYYKDQLKNLLSRKKKRLVSFCLIYFILGICC